MAEVSINKIVVYTEYLIKSLLKYKISFLYGYILSPFFVTLSLYLTGKFVRNIIYLGILMKYGIFIILAELISTIFYPGIRLFWDKFLSRKSLITIQFIGINNFTLAYILFSIFQVIIYCSFLYLWSYLFFGLSPKILIMVIFLSIFLVPATYFFSLFLASLILVFRTDAIIFANLIIRIFRKISPIYFSIYVISEKFRALLYLFPQIILIEELRKLLLGLYISNDFWMAIILCIVYTSLVYLLFLKIYSYSRKIGKIALY